ncbi:hypothetical protein MPUT_0084 [Mycoplasma putrefaciens KS1]|uniref:Uncharacterized protein n=1 Tax=Mycoplasma putrefaciens (strain ATCC 15718 / NCTC 10155 / C30 KS-1 / KS-1) TaxID=743965 RepID=A0A7U4E9F4_MYCPK|nr:hypothetical protein MPUT_0084 [Mycoplasma putrefaciens KS1]
MIIKINDGSLTIVKDNITIRNQYLTKDYTVLYQKIRKF